MARRWRCMSSCRSSSISRNRPLLLLRLRSQCLAAHRCKDRLELPFHASVWSWDDIRLELSFRQSLAIKLYPETLTTYAFDPLEIEIPVSDSHNRLQIGFTRPAVKDLLGPPMLANIRQIAVEVTDNAFRHGRATSATVKTRLDELIITDDGVVFDFTTAKPISPSSAGGRSGISARGLLQLQWTVRGQTKFGLVSHEPWQRD